MWISMNRFLCSSLVLWTLAGNETYMLLMPKPTFSINIKVSLHEIRSKVSNPQQCKTAKRFVSGSKIFLKIYDIWTWQSYTIMTYLTYQIFRYCGIPCGKSNMSSCLEPCDFCSSLNSRLAACTRASRCLSVPKQISNRPGFNQIHQKTVSKWSIIRYLYI